MSEPRRADVTTPKEPPRRRYERPEIEKIRLVLEESVLATCKRGGGGPLDPRNCNSCVTNHTS